MKTNWTAPGKGSSIAELVQALGEWPHCVSVMYPATARTNLYITKTGVVEAYDLARLHSLCLEVAP